MSAHNRINYKSGLILSLNMRRRFNLWHLRRLEVMRIYKSRQGSAPLYFVSILMFCCTSESALFLILRWGLHVCMCKYVIFLVLLYFTLVLLGLIFVFACLEFVFGSLVKGSPFEPNINKEKNSKNKKIVELQDLV